LFITTCIEKQCTRPLTSGKYKFYVMTFNDNRGSKITGSTTLHRKRIYANPSSYPNSNPNTSPNLNPKAQLCFRTDEMTSFFDQVYRTTDTKITISSEFLVIETCIIIGFGILFYIKKRAYDYFHPTLFVFTV